MRLEVIGLALLVDVQGGTVLVSQGNVEMCETRTANGEKAAAKEKCYCISTLGGTSDVYGKVGMNGESS